ncbi:DUF2637 domain-containing protein [Methanospirillum purgamenti]|uniref:DUF2637 domain-containing protein n=1 Tax=Methanospirillum hungatei TaxID=2203 RepID=A0A8F5VP26_METHU|nr:DUF2637 domain-containing protein [Methanospirillum hungatei]
MHKKTESLVPAATGTLTLAVALCSFVFSFESLRSSAVEAGFDPLLAWCWPICIDALLISGSLMALLGNSPRITFSIRVDFFTVVDIFNIRVFSLQTTNIPPKNK